MTLYDSIKNFGKKAVIYPLVGLLGVITVAGCATPKPDFSQRFLDIKDTSEHTFVPYVGPEDYQTGFEITKRTLDDFLGNKMIKIYENYCSEREVEEMIENLSRKLTPNEENQKMRKLIALAYLMNEKTLKESNFVRHLGISENELGERYSVDSCLEQIILLWGKEGNPKLISPLLKKYGEIK